MIINAMITLVSAAISLMKNRFSGGQNSPGIKHARFMLMAEFMAQKADILINDQQQIAGLHVSELCVRCNNNNPPSSKPIYLPPIYNNTS